MRLAKETGGVTAEPESVVAIDVVSAVVVNYNAKDVLSACLSSLRAEGIDEIVVVDNGSVDGSESIVRAWDPAVVWVPTGANVGYGRAANLGAGHTASGAVLVCNPDVVLRPGAVAALVAALDADPCIGIVGPRLLNADGSIYPSARSFPSLVDAVGHGLLGQVWTANPFSRRYKLLDWDHASQRFVDWVSGACLLVRRPAWEEIGGFDPSFFMYMEDVDLCWRARRAGWAVLYQPAGEVTHLQGVSTNATPYRMIVAHHRSLWRFAERTTTGWRRLALPVLAPAMATRAGFACLRHCVAVRRARRFAVDRHGSAGAVR
jgi:N-acetylglucosaminyl-diphospho-decaprenol L-rhamnosyltransferase